MSCDSQEVAISVSGLTKSYNVYAAPFHRLLQSFLRGWKQLFREVVVLQDVTFEVLRGETVGIVGANGAGKSTLLQVISGTLSPTAGSVQIDGRVAALLELGAGFNPEFTGIENIKLAASIYGLTNEEIEARLDAIVEFADIGDFVYQPVKTYSSGMYVRLGFAVIAHVDADVMIIDEALAVGDAYFNQKCMRFLRRFRENGTLLFVSHDMGSVTNFCQRAIWLEQGRIRMIDEAKEVARQYLRSMYERGRDVDLELEDSTTVTATAAATDFWDQRRTFLNNSNLRNDLEVFTFDASGDAFGEGGATIFDAYIVDHEKRPLQWIVGGERVELVIRVRANETLDSPIIGWSVLDSLGQVLFGDNTYLTYVESPLQIPAGSCFEGRFSFTMPILPVGKYVCQVAIATGSQMDHRQQHWIHEGFLFESHASSVRQGLAGIPMHNVEIRIANE